MAFFYLVIFYLNYFYFDIKSMQATYARQLFDSLSKLSKPHEVLSDRVEELFHL